MEFLIIEFLHLGQNLAVTGIEDLQWTQFFFESWFLTSGLIIVSTGLNVGSVSRSGAGSKY